MCVCVRVCVCVCFRGVGVHNCVFQTMSNILVIDWFRLLSFFKCRNIYDVSLISRHLSRLTYYNIILLHIFLMYAISHSYERLYLHFIFYILDKYGYQKRRNKIVIPAIDRNLYQTKNSLLCENWSHYISPTLSTDIIIS